MAAKPSKLIARLNRIAKLCAAAAPRPSCIVRVGLKDGKPFAADLARNHGAAVAFAPEAASLEEWEAIAVASQRRLKDEVRN